MAKKRKAKVVEVMVGSEAVLNAWEAEIEAIELGNVPNPRIVGLEWWPEDGKGLLMVEVHSSDDQAALTFSFEDTDKNMTWIDDLRDRVLRLRAA